ncbi:hypothetical protein [Hahella ganghwensis]|uniref:hypothetical protein n=1 Tax=Hahella ganghwensis TaxID=286420 RepID=UPI00036125D1|nr:hypothetical protein [Hahella ganghwensis]
MAGKSVDKDDYELRSFDDVSVDEIAELALQAGKQARDRALNAGLEVCRIDEQGRTVIDKKLPDGTIQTTIQEESKEDDQKA